MPSRTCGTALAVAVLAAAAACGAARGPAGAVADAGLADLVRARLARELAARPSTVDVAVTNGVAMLTGVVPSDRARRRAVNLARETPGVREVVDALHVSPGAGPEPGVAPEPDDTALAVHVAERLAAGAFPGSRAERAARRGAAQVTGPDVDVSVRAEAGRVHLSGTVGSIEAIGRAVDAAQAVPGVAAVSADLSTTIRSQSPLAR